MENMKNIILPVTLIRILVVVIFHDVNASIHRRVVLRGILLVSEFKSEY